MELYDVMRTTFAARDYTGEEMPDEVLYEILENARFAPSGTGLGLGTLPSNSLLTYVLDS